MKILRTLHLGVVSETVLERCVFNYFPSTSNPEFFFFPTISDFPKTFSPSVFGPFIVRPRARVVPHSRPGRVCRKYIGQNQYETWPQTFFSRTVSVVETPVLRRRMPNGFCEPFADRPRRRSRNSRGTRADVVKNILRGCARVILVVRLVPRGRFIFPSTTK